VAAGGCRVAAGGEQTDGVSGHSPSLPLIIIYSMRTWWQHRAPEQQHAQQRGIGRGGSSHRCPLLAHLPHAAHFRYRDVAAAGTLLAYNSCTAGAAAARVSLRAIRMLPYVGGIQEEENKGSSDRSSLLFEILPLRSGGRRGREMTTVNDGVAWWRQIAKHVMKSEK